MSVMMSLFIDVAQELFLPASSFSFVWMMPDGHCLYVTLCGHECNHVKAIPSIFYVFIPCKFEKTLKIHHIVLSYLHNSVCFSPHIADGMESYGFSHFLHGCINTRRQAHRCMRCHRVPPTRCRRHVPPPLHRDRTPSSGKSQDPFLFSRASLYASPVQSGVRPRRGTTHATS